MKGFGEVNPDSIMDELFVRNVISTSDVINRLSSIFDLKIRCRKLLYLLQGITHPETFIHLRDALRGDYPQIVDEIDKQLTLQPAPQPQQQQPHMSQTTEGKLLRVLSSLLSACRSHMGSQFDANLLS